MDKEENGIDILGKLHEITFYGLIATFISFINNKLTLDLLFSNISKFDGYLNTSISFLFW